MKKVSKAVAIILIFVMIACSFTGCIYILPLFAETPAAQVGLIILGAVLDVTVCILLFGPAGLDVLQILWGAEAAPPDEDGTGVYLAGAEYYFSTDCYSLMEKLNALPDAEKAALAEKLNSLPETKLASLTDTVYSLPQAEIAASIERLNSLSEAELASAVQGFNSLSETDFDTLADKLKERLYLPTAEYVIARPYAIQK
jgi:hypothetical protein